jgi:hypothetical protein
MIDLEVYAAGVRNLEKILELDHEFEAVPGLRYKVDSNHDIVYLEFEEPTMTIQEIRGVFSQTWARTAHRWADSCRSQSEEQDAADPRLIAGLVSRRIALRLPAVEAALLPQAPPEDKQSFVDGRHVRGGGVREKGRPVNGRASEDRAAPTLLCLIPSRRKWSVETKVRQAVCDRRGRMR